MKKVIAIILSLIMISAFMPLAFAEEKEISSFGAYEHVFILGVDGAGRFVKDADTPNFDRIFGDGAIYYRARTEVKTDSAPNWSSMLYGVSVFKHKLQNGDVGEAERTSKDEFPSVFCCARDAFPDATLASFVNWSPINKTIVENDVDVYKYNNGDDAVVKQAVCDYLDAGNVPTLLFLQLDSVDHFGHEKGSKSEEFLNQLNIVDGYIGDIYDAIERNGLLDSSLILFIADHGHTTIGGHGGLSMRESQVTIAAAGKTVKKGGTFDSQTRNRDIAAITLYALGIDKPDYMSSRVPSNLFNGFKGELRSFKADPLDAFVSALSWILTLFTAAF